MMHATYRFPLPVLMRRLALLVALSCLASAADRPNVILIVCDDLGYGDLGCYGQKIVRTPALDRMAAQGTRFTQFYCGTSVCAPSRCSLMTGLHVGHTPIRANGVEGRIRLGKERPSMGVAMKGAGYATACIGKWGLAPAGQAGDARDLGFDHFFGYHVQRQGHEQYPDFLIRERERVPLQRKAYAHDLFTADALSWVRAHRDQPFFLYLAYTLPHAAYEVPDLGIYADIGGLDHEQRTVAAMISRLDSDVGKLSALLKELGLDERTLVLFTSDNGPARDFFNSAGPLRGRKRDMYEGGIRVPMIARWPGRVPAGRVSDTPWAMWDLLPTLATLAGAPLPAGSGIDGLDVSPLLLGREAPQRPFFYWELHEREGFVQALRAGHLKVVRRGAEGGIELYDLAADPGERRNLARERPADAQRLAALMESARSDDPAWPRSPARER